MRKATLTLALLGTAVLPFAGVSGASAASGTSYQATLSPVPTNKVTGSGTAMVALDGNTAKITVTSNNLLDNSPHAQHIHFQGAGECPAADAASKHNGLLSMNTTDGSAAYGGIGTSLTTTGDTSPASGLAITRFPTKGTNSYTRTITLTPDVAAAVRADNAVIVVHGIDYNNNGKYDAVLGASDLDPKLPAEATDPALCGALHASQMSVPSGSAATGDGSTQDAGQTGVLAAGGALLAVAGLAGAYSRRRRTVSAK